MKEFLKSLLSRKFLLALGTALVFIASEQYDQALYVVLAYLGFNTAQKFVSSGSSLISGGTSNANSSVDTSEVFTGSYLTRTFDQKDE